MSRNKNALPLPREGDGERIITMKNYTTPLEKKQDLAAKKYEMAKWVRHNEKLLAKKMAAEPEKASEILRLRGEDCRIEGDVVCRNATHPQTPSSGPKPAEAGTMFLHDGTPVEFEYRWINSAKLEVDKSYQLPLNQKRVQMIIKAFDPRLLDPIKVSFRDGRYLIIDGHHRTNACTGRNGGKPVNMYAKIYFNLTQEQEAYLFAKQTGVTRKPGFIPTLNALLLSKDKESLDFVDITEAAGFTLALDGEALGQWRIGCVRKAFEYYRKLGRDSYFDMLLILANWKQGSVDSLRKEIIGGLGMLFKTYGAQLDQKRLISRLVGVDVSEIRKQANPYTRSVDKKYAQGFAALYNFNLRSNKLSILPLMDQE